MGQQASNTAGEKVVDPDLKVVVDKWVDLTPAERAELREMVKTANDRNDNKG